MHPDAPGWIFRYEETSISVYRCDGHDTIGNVVSHQGTDTDDLLIRCVADARSLSNDRAIPQDDLGHCP
jgi:hypothetical protein